MTTSKPLKKNKQRETVKAQRETVNLKNTNKNQQQAHKTNNGRPSTLKGCFSRHNSDILKNLTDTETEILTYLSVDFLTPGQIAVKRKTSKQAVNSIIQNLRNKGVINAVNKRVDKTRPTCQPSQSIRLHAQEFNIKIIHKDERYLKRLQKTNFLISDGNRVQLYKNSMEIYSGQMFYGESAQASTSKSFVYWNRFFTKLENDLKIVILKDRYQNIKLVNSHYAEIHNEFSKDCNINAEKIKISTTEDGKLWFLIDNSFNLHEAETVHPQTAKPDIENVTRHFNDIRDTNPPVLSEILYLIKQQAEANRETARGLQAIMQIITPPTIPPEHHTQPTNPRDLSYIG